MKKILPIIVLFLFLIPVKSQITDFNLEIYQGLDELNIPSLIMSKDLKGAPRVFRVTIFPENIKVLLTGKITWLPTDGPERKLYYFETKPFLSKSFTNNDIGSNDIKIAKDGEGEKDAFQKIIEKGKPTGQIKVELTLQDLDFHGEPKKASGELIFVNPTTSFEIISPRMGDYYDIGSVMAEWTIVPGINAYKVKAAVRKYKTQSADEALNSGDPLINNKEVSSNIVNLRQLLDREWLPGQEIVLQVAAVSQSAGGQKELVTNPVIFNLNNNAGGVFSEENIADIILQVNSLDDLQKLNIKEITVDGKRLNAQEILELLQYLKSNPDMVISKRFNRR